MPAASRAFRGSCFAIAASPALDLAGTGEEVPSHHRDDDGDDDYPDNRAIATLRCDLDFGHPPSVMVRVRLAHSSCRDSASRSPGTDRRPPTTANRSPITNHRSPINELQLPDALASPAARRPSACRAGTGDHAISTSESACSPALTAALFGMPRARRR